MDLAGPPMNVMIKEQFHSVMALVIIVIHSPLWLTQLPT
jgi:hypothetical protein